jgi:hypothetical protein
MAPSLVLQACIFTSVFSRQGVPGETWLFVEAPFSRESI